MEPLRLRPHPVIPYLPPSPRTPPLHLPSTSRSLGKPPSWPRPLRTEPDPEEETPASNPTRRRGNWVMSILRIGARWGEEEKEEKEEEEEEEEKEGERVCGGDECGVEEEEEVVEIGRDEFGRLLRRVSLAEARFYARMSDLGNLAYGVPNIKPQSLLKHRGLRFVTSSSKKKGISTNTDPETSDSQISKADSGSHNVDDERNGISAAAAYQIAASAASYVQSQTKKLLPFRLLNRDTGTDRHQESSGNESGADIASPEEASFVATTNSVTAVVAAKEEVKEAVAKDLNSALTSPCEWFICNDDSSGTRYFIIQGSESMASWQANLLFEPIQFEGLDVLVHRGIYEAAKGMYDQMLPEVRAHLEGRGKTATLCFTGHSLGGSLSLLINLMLLMRGDAPASSLLPVITFGAPTIMCGGNRLLRKLGLPRSHVQAITMHRDIVPRAFSCNYPDHVTQILKAVNRNFRNHPCLKHQKLLYEPMGELLILQPDEKFSPHHHLLPSGSGLYILDHSSTDLKNPGRILRAAKSIFLNSPHPLEILSDRGAYGSEGTVTRDHDMKSYLRSIRNVIKEELIEVRKAKREQRHTTWLSLVPIGGKGVGILIGWRPTLKILDQINLGGVYNGSVKSLQRFQKAVVSRNLHVVLVFLLPVRFLLLKALAVISFI